MQACKAYYRNGRFIPVGFGILPEGTQAIITVLEEIPKSKEERLRELNAIIAEIRAGADEEMPPIERIKFREVELCMKPETPVRHCERNVVT